MHEAFAPLVKVLEKVSSVFPQLQNENLWWRGQSQRGLKLLPKVFRGYSVYAEANFIHNFRDEAPIRYPGWPQEKSLQFILMQHYGLPTRLLDWTREIFTGLYFAVCNEKKDEYDGSLWALNPAALNNSQVGLTKVLTLEDAVISSLLNNALTCPHERVYLLS